MSATGNSSPLKTPTRVKVAGGPGPSTLGQPKFSLGDAASGESSTDGPAVGTEKYAYREPQPSVSVSLKASQSETEPRGIAPSRSISDGRSTDLRGFSTAAPKQLTKMEKLLASQGVETEFIPKSGPERFMTSEMATRIEADATPTSPEAAKMQREVQDVAKQIQEMRPGPGLKQEMEQMQQLMASMQEQMAEQVKIQMQQQAQQHTGVRLYCLFSALYAILWLY